MLAPASHLAGPNLTPETFRDGMFRRPPIDRADHRRRPRSRGATTRGPADYNDQDDATASWWDPDATGPDETGERGQGHVPRYVDGGKRYLPSEWPTEPEACSIRRARSRSTTEVPDPAPETTRRAGLPPPHRANRQ